MLSAYEEKLSRIETEHLSCSDSEAAARANTESQIRILTEERDQLKRNLRSRERDWTNSLEEIQRLQLNENDKNQEMSVLQMKVKELQIEVSNLRKNSDSDQWELEKVKKEKNDLEHKVDVLENAMKEGVNHSVRFIFLFETAGCNSTLLEYVIYFQIIYRKWKVDRFGF